MAEKTDLTIAEKHGLISRFLKNVLELGGYIIVHDDGTISYANKPDEPIMIRAKGNSDPRPLVVYRVQTSIPKAIILNPFVEPIGQDPTDKIWFYNTTNMIHATVFARIIEFLFSNVIKAANGQEIDDPNLVHVLSGIVGSADPKTEKEFSKVIKELPEFQGGLDEEMENELSLITDSPKPKDFITISRSKKEKKTILTTFLHDQENDLKKKFGTKIRKKTWTLIEKLFKEVYATENIYDPIFEEVTEQKRCPTFLTYVKVLIQSWNKFIPYLQYLYGDDGAEEQITKIIFLESMLDKIDDLAGVAHWARGCVTGSIELKNGDYIPNEDETTITQVAKAPTRKQISEDEAYYEKVKQEAEQDLVAQPSGKSALDVLDEQNRSRGRYNSGYDRYRRDDRDYGGGYRRDDPPWDDDRRDRRDDYDRRRDYNGGSRSALDVMDAERSMRRGYSSGHYRRDADRYMPYRPQGRMLRF